MISKFESSSAELEKLMRAKNFQIALASPRTDGSRTVALLIGAGMIMASVIAAIVFAIWITDQAVGVSMPNR